MTAVVVAAFDAAGDDAVLEVRRRVRRAGVLLPARPPHRPHLTLDAVRVPSWQLPEVAAGLADVAATHAPAPVTLGRLGRFSRSGALWLGPDDSPALAALHDATVAALRAIGPPAFTGRPWVPHCTLATRLHPAHSRDLLAELEPEFGPVRTHVAALAVILVGGSGDEALLPLTAAGPSA